MIPTLMIPLATTPTAIKPFACNPALKKGQSPYEKRSPQSLRKKQIKSTSTTTAIREQRKRQSFQFARQQLGMFYLFRQPPLQDDCAPSSRWSQTSAFDVGIFYVFLSDQSKGAGERMQLGQVTSSLLLCILCSHCYMQLVWKLWPQARLLTDLNSGSRVFRQMRQYSPWQPSLIVLII